MYILLLGVSLLSACTGAVTPVRTPSAITPVAPVTLPTLPAGLPQLNRQPIPADWGRGPLATLPVYNSQSTDPEQVDLRSHDLSALDLRRSLNDLLYADFDDRTTWPPADRLPQGFDPQQIMALGQNPGLGMRALHQQGITGRGVGIAIIDQVLLTTHQEYADRLLFYEETDDIQSSWQESSMHGAAVASIAVGQTVGVAPEADLYYIATGLGNSNEVDFAYLARAIRRILELNQQLPAGRKIRVISASIGWGPQSKGYAEITAAVAETKAAGLLIVCSSIEDPTVYGLKFHGLGRAPLADPDSFSSYEPGLWWAQEFYNGMPMNDRLLVPMDARTTASPTGNDEYVFYRMGGWSWAIPYIAATYALAAQVDSTITPERFWALALATGQTIPLKHGLHTLSLGPILDPAALIAALQKGTAQ